MYESARRVESYPPPIRSYGAVGTLPGRDGKSRQCPAWLFPNAARHMGSVSPNKGLGNCNRRFYTFQ
jgi:hypothetical protein